MLPRFVTVEIPLPPPTPTKIVMSASLSHAMGSMGNRNERVASIASSTLSIAYQDIDACFSSIEK